MKDPVKIGFAGTDARTLLSAVMVSSAQSDTDTTPYHGVVIRGTPAMPRVARNIMGWDVSFVQTRDNSVSGYADAIAQAFEKRELDYVVPMPESLIFNGLVDLLDQQGLGRHIAGLNQKGAFIEGDKIKCKELCRRAGIPVADSWTVADAGSFAEVSAVVLDYIHTHGGAVLKFPYSAGGKGARIILNTWEVRDVYDSLMQDYKKAYKQMFKNRMWPLLVESRMSGVEISFTILVDGNGAFQILPTSMDYPERFAGPASFSNPITGGMGSISPHPFESRQLMEMVQKTIALPLVDALGREGLLRPCILYPGCFVSLERQGDQLVPKAIRVCEINIRPGEPEFQTVIRRIKNPGRLFWAMFNGRLDKIVPEVREDQISLSCALVIGPGGPDGQKGYPWRVTRNEKVEIDYPYMKKKGIQVIPSAMGYSEEKGYISDGTRVAYLVQNGRIKKGVSREAVAEKMVNRAKNIFGSGRARVVPREDENGNRLAMREDIGRHYITCQNIVSV